MKHKKVQFNVNLEEVRLFDKYSCPLLLSGKAPLSIYPLNFNHGANYNSEVKLEKVELNTSKDKIEGIVKVLNLAFHKKVTLRASFNNWHSFQEFNACYECAIEANNQDQFRFAIPIPEDLLTTIEPKRYHLVQFAVKYQVDGKVYWDNNKNQNYKIELRPELSVDPNYFSKVKKQNRLKERYSFQNQEISSGKYGKQVQLDNIFKPFNLTLYKDKSFVLESKPSTYNYESIEYATLSSSPPIFS